MVKSSAYPDLERKPGGPDNWVEAVGGLPPYIERIAKHLHYERGFTISHAIATAVNTVKRWARKGGVVKYNDPERHTVTTITAAQAARAVAEWEAKKARGSAASRGRGRISLSSPQQGVFVDLAVLAERANRIEDPAMRGEARMRILDMAVSAKSRQAAFQAGATMEDKSFPIRNADELKKAIRLWGNAKDPAAAKRHIISRARALGLTSMIPDSWKIDLANSYALLEALTAKGVIDLALTKDGRKSYKRRGKWKHGFIPVNHEARVAKAKGSPIAMKRITRLFTGTGRSKSAQERDVKPAKIGFQVGREAKEGTGTERVQRVAQARNLKARDATRTQKVTPQQLEVSRGRRPDKRANIRWEDIKDTDKVVRNGKRYVLTTYAGRQSLTEWIGPQGEDVVAPDQRDKEMRTLSARDVTEMTTAQLRRMLALPGQSQQVRDLLNKELRRKESLGLVGGKRR
jgi:hypothetical protein